MHLGAMHWRLWKNSPTYLGSEVGPTAIKGRWRGEHTTGEGSHSVPDVKEEGV